MALLLLCKVEESLRRKDQALVVEFAFFANPGEHCEVGGRGWPKARDSDVDGWAWMNCVYGHRFHLQSDHVPVRPVPHEDFGGLRIWKWAEQVHVASLRHSADDFLFPSKPEVAGAELWRLHPCSRDTQHPRHPKFLEQPASRAQPGHPTAVE